MKMSNISNAYTFSNDSPGYGVDLSITPADTGAHNNDSQGMNYEIQWQGNFIDESNSTFKIKTNTNLTK